MLKKIENVAALAGLKGAIDNEGRHFAMGFHTTAGRSQQVFVRPTGKTPNGQAIVTLFSPALVVKKGMFSGMTKDQAVELLKLNENTFFARFGIWESDKESMIVASSDLLLETLDPDELKAHAFYVAFAADNYESKHGSDKF
jgi:hypothetical protein